MSEPIKNTLFRFATMRTPELIPEKEKRDYHIHHPNPATTGFFASALANPAATQAAQLAALTTLAAGFTNSALKTTQEIKTYVGDNFFDFSVWLAKNHTAVFNKTAAPYGGTMPTALNSTKIIGLWDNLFYQLIKGISPQVRQFCIELLVANGYIGAQEADKHQLAVARVIIPTSFYGAAAVNPLAPFAPATPVQAQAAIYSGEHKKMLEAFIASEKIGKYNNLLTELKQVEKKYLKQNATDFEAALNDYNVAFKAAMDEFNGKKGGAESPAAEVEPKEETPPTDSPNLPEFNFKPAAEMETSYLEAKFTTEAFNTAQQLGLPGNTSFAEAGEAIINAIAAASEKTTVLNEQSNQSIILNGMTFPVNRSGGMNIPLYSFAMESLYMLVGTRIEIYCSLYMGAPDEHIVSASYNAEFNGNTFSDTVFTETAGGNYLFLKFYTPQGLAVPLELNQMRFYGTLTTANGVKLKFDFPFVIKSTGTSGIMEVVQTEEGGGQTTQPPSGYGIKRIGLADYRRVEQSVCCYLPGEVSHIENVMAREYKERSTRRLTRSEDTTVLEKSMEKETQKDTSTTDRYELQKEVDSVITKDMSVEAHANVQYKPTEKLAIDAGASFAYNTSREDSNHTAVNYSKEVTEKALERVVQKVREERTIKIIEEFEEQNKHGYDNRQGDQHISGVYRWIDKVYKNQVFNYGKRLMYEFMIPEPAVFHNEAIKLIVKTGGGELLTPPPDPRKAVANTLANFTQATDNTVAYWSGMYNVEIPARPDENFYLSKAFEMNIGDAPGRNYTGAKSYKLELPEGYEAISAKVGATFMYHPDKNEGAHLNLRIGDLYYAIGSGNISVINPVSFATPIRKELAVSAEVTDLGGLTMQLVIYCKRTPEATRQWQIECFNAIIKAYEEALDAYNKAVAAQKKPDGVINLNPGFYRQIENSVLRKACISYLVTHDKMGKDLYKTGTSGASNIQVNVDSTLDSYSSMVKFIEQAFEWEILSYRFYPFYWGKKENWQQNYQVECDDPIFRSFLQSGMARAIVSVRPGFEEAVMYFMATGQIWNGGQVPAIGDDLYLSIVEELKNPEYYIDETWETRVPTTLTVIQSGAIGLEAEGLPCACGDENDVEQNENKLGVVLPG